MIQTFVLARNADKTRIELVHGEFGGIAVGNDFERDPVMAGCMKWTVFKIFGPDSQSRLAASAVLMGPVALNRLFAIDL